MKQTISITPGEVTTPVLHGYLLGAVGPRPIAFASTIDEAGRPNLSPFSFFNVFSANPPVMIFSPARRVRDNSTKHTLENILATRQVVINIVDFQMVQQMSLASTEYPAGENEFLKAGLTMLKSELVRPFRVAESPVQFECEVSKVEALGEEGGAGNLVFSRVVRMHIQQRILDEKGVIDQSKIDQVARMGGNWYTRASMGLFEVPKPLSSLGIGIDRMPESIRNSKYLSGNDLGKLGNISDIPPEDEINRFISEEPGVQDVLASGDAARKAEKAKEYLNNNDILSAWKVLLANSR